MPDGSFTGHAFNWEQLSISGVEVGVGVEVIVGSRWGGGWCEAAKAELIDFSVSIIRYVQAIRAYGYPFRIVNPPPGPRKTREGNRSVKGPHFPRASETYSTLLALSTAINSAPDKQDSVPHCLTNPPWPLKTWTRLFP